MFKNFIILALRNIKKNKGYSFINIFGLAIGIASCLLIISYVHHELTYDSMHLLKESIYRINGKIPFGDTVLINGITGAPLAITAENEIPEVIDSLRMTRFRNKPVQINNRTFIEEAGFFSENNYFKFFKTKLLKGDPDKVLSEPFTLVINETLSKKYFGDENPIGKTLRITVGKTYDFKVTGLMADLPSNTVMNKPLILSFATFEQTHKKNLIKWEDWGWVTSFVLLKKGSDPTIIGEKITKLALKHLSEKSKNVSYFLQNIENIYLDNRRLKINNGLDNTGNITRIYIFSLIAFLILIVAVINFINLSTAKVTNRIKEVGIYKSCGADRNHLVWRFLSESILLTSTALIIGLALFTQFKPHLDQYLGKNLTLDFFQTPLFILTICLMVLIIGTISGAYPAFYLSKFKISEILSNRVFKRSSRSGIRWILVGAQFFIAIILIFSTLIVNKQVNYTKTKDLGYKTDNLLLLKNWSSYQLKNTEIIKREILNKTDAVSASKIGSFPHTQNRSMGVFKKERNNPDEKGLYSQTISVDQDFVKTMGLTLLKGRNFGQNKIENERSIMINESAIKKFGLKNPIGKQIFQENEVYTVIGVLKDWNTNSIHSRIYSTVLQFSDETAKHLLIRFPKNSNNDIITQVKKVWTGLYSNEIFDCNLLESIFLKSYIQEKRLGNLLISFCQLIIIIACLGIVGLASFSTEQRKKEIGIRKILGAKVSSITFLLTKSYTKSILIAGILAFPLGYYAVRKWLSNFVFQTPIGIDPFIITIFIVMTLSLISVMYHTIKAAIANPVKSISYE